MVDNGQVFPPEIYLMADSKLREDLAHALAVVAALGLALGVPNTASAAHSLRAATRCVLGAAAAAGYPLDELERLKTSAVTTPAMAEKMKANEEGGKGATAEAVEESEESEGGGVGMAGLFGNSDEESDEWEKW